MDEEFKLKLKEALETFDSRMRQLEHLVNDVIIGSLESAATEYADNEAFENFKGNYGEKLAGLIDPYKKLFGEDYDLERNLYDDLKATEGYGSEGFDEAACMEARIADLQSRFDALKSDVAEKKEESEAEGKAEGKAESEAEDKKDDKDDDKDDVEVEVVSEEQLKKEFEDAMKEGASE